MRKGTAEKLYIFLSAFARLNLSIYMYGSLAVT